jgi:hypothetical protein
MRKTEEILAWGKFVKAFIRILYGISKIVRRSLKSSVLQNSMDGIKEEPESDDSQPPSPLEEYEPIFIKTEHFEPETLPIMKCEAVVSLTY